jgi:hypothetical protein
MYEVVLSMPGRRRELRLGELAYELGSVVTVAGRRWLVEALEPTARRGADGQFVLRLVPDRLPRHRVIDSASSTAGVAAGRASTGYAGTP